jgi:hypothetical protein
MRIQVADQQVLKAVQSVLRATFGLPKILRDRSPKPQPRSELLHLKMLHIGDLLIDALRLERDLSEDEGLAQWRACRAVVDHLVQDYASALAAWSEAVEEDFRK